MWFQSKIRHCKGSDTLIALKPKNSKFVHTGCLVPVGTKDGRKPKRRLKAKLDLVIDAASDVKAAPVNALDVKKGAVSLQQMDVTYKQSWQVLTRNRNYVDARGKESYHMLVPYLEHFSKINPNSLSIHECDGDKHLTRVFVCPGTHPYVQVLFCKSPH